MAEEYAFLPIARTALVANAAAPPGGLGRRQVRLGFRPLANGTSHGDPITRHAAELRGAGDVVAIDPDAIARVEPRPGARAFEPNYFPYCDFRDADYPWRESLDMSSGARVKPWLCLIALEPHEFVRLDRGIAPLPRIVVAHAATSLPDLEQSWAMAHVQTNRFGGSIDAAMADPNASFSRVFCTRRLKESTQYSLILVPVFEAGRLRGLGRSPEVDPFDTLAWDAGTVDAIELPVLGEWTFTTSILEDFESLVKRLKPLDDPAAQGTGSTRNVSAGSPGYYTLRDDSIRIEVEGALQTPGFERAVEPIQTHAFTPLLEETLTRVVQSRQEPEGGPIDDGPDLIEDPLVALPVYGRHYAAPSSIEAEPDSNPWVHEVNLDLRFRAAAGVGSRIVKRHQERLARIAWKQIGALVDANWLITRLQAADRIGSRMVDKHITPLPTSTALLIVEPMLDLVSMPGPSPRSIGGALDRLGVPKGSRRHELRRIGARRPVRIRGARDFAVPLFGVPGASDLPSGAPAAVRATDRGAARAERVAALGLVDAIIDRSVVPPSLSASAAVNLGAPVFEVGSFEPVPLLDAVTSELKKIPSKKAVMLVMGAAIEEQALVRALEPIERGPRITLPLSRHVEEEDPNFILPNIAGQPDDTVILLQENREFIASLMIGANRELNRELRWREAPISMTQTALRRFWDRGASWDDTDADDIDPIDDWDGHLADGFGDGGESRLVVAIKAELVRRYPEILVAINRQRIPSGGQWKHDRGETFEPIFFGQLGDDVAYFGFELSLSELNRRLDETYVVIYEPPGRFRFGLDIASYSNRAARADFSRSALPFATATLSERPRLTTSDPLRAVMTHQPTTPAGPMPANTDDLSWEHLVDKLHASGYIDFDKEVAFQDADPAWGPNRNSASLARATRQKPLRVVISASHLVPHAG